MIRAHTAGHDVTCHIIYKKMMLHQFHFFKITKPFPNQFNDTKNVTINNLLSYNDNNMWPFYEGIATLYLPIYWQHYNSGTEMLKQGSHLIKIKQIHFGYPNPKTNLKVHAVNQIICVVNIICLEPAIA